MKTPVRKFIARRSGTITHFVAGIGTGGTMMGTGRYLKEVNPNIQVIAVEPDDALHGLEGLKHMASSIVPGIYHEEKLDAQNSGVHRRRLCNGVSLEPGRRGFWSDSLPGPRCLPP